MCYGSQVLKARQVREPLAAPAGSLSWTTSYWQTTYKNSERQFPSNLPVSRELLTDRRSECAVRQIRIDEEVGMIEQVEELKAQLKIDSFGDARALVRREVGLGEARLTELLSLFISVGAGSWRCKLSRRKDAIQIFA